jgi:hypothetical protein
MDAYDRLTIGLDHLETGLAMLTEEVGDLDGDHSIATGKFIKRAYFILNAAKADAKASRAAADAMLESVTAAESKPALREVTR